MEYIPILIVGIFFIFPIIVPLIFWLVIDKKESKIFTISLHVRRFWAILTVVLVAVTIYKNALNFGFEFLGQVVAQLIIAALLWKKWAKSSENINTEITQ
jgi:hypothetical protein